MKLGTKSKWNESFPLKPKWIILVENNIGIQGGYKTDHLKNESNIAIHSKDRYS